MAHKQYSRIDWFWISLHVNQTKKRHLTIQHNVINIVHKLSLAVIFEIFDNHYLPVELIFLSILTWLWVFCNLLFCYLMTVLPGDIMIWVHVAKTDPLFAHFPKDWISIITISVTSYYHGPMILKRQRFDWCVRWQRRDQLCIQSLLMPAFLMWF